MSFPCQCLLLSVQTLMGPKAKADIGAAWCEGEKPTATYDRAPKGSTLQGSCDLDLIESISKWLEKSEDGTYCNGFRDIAIAGLRTRHQRIQYHKL